MENFNQMKEKLNYIESSLQQEILANPLRELQIAHRKELLEFKEIFDRELQSLENKDLNSINQNNNENNCNNSSEEAVKELERRLYQIKILKNAFKDFQEKSNEEIVKITNENIKLKYRIGILLNGFNDLEKKQSK